MCIRDRYVDAPVLIAKDTAYVPLWVLINDMGFELREEGNGLLLVRGLSLIHI